MTELVHTAQKNSFKKRAQQTHRQRCEHQRRPKAGETRNAVADVGAQHVKTGMRKIKHAHHAENQRQP